MLHLNSSSFLFLPDVPPVALRSVGSVLVPPVVLRSIESVLVVKARVWWKYWSESDIGTDISDFLELNQKVLSWGS